MTLRTSERQSRKGKKRMASEKEEREGSRIPAIALPHEHWTGRKMDPKEEGGVLLFLYKG